jgi:hypothetical protein
VVRGVAILHSALVIYSLKTHIHLTCKNQIKRTSGKYQKACELENWHQKACKLENRYHKACELESWYQQPCKLGIGIRGLEALKLVYQKLGRLQFVYQKLGSFELVFRNLELNGIDPRSSEASKFISEAWNWFHKLRSLEFVSESLESWNPGTGVRSLEA